MPDDVLRYQILVRLTEEEHREIEAMADGEMRKAANMARVLLREALVARRAQVEPPRPKSGERRKFPGRQEGGGRA